MKFKFFTGTSIHFGTSCFYDLLDMIKKLEFDRIGVVLDHNISNLDVTKSLIDRLDKIVDLVIGQVNIVEPTYRYLDEFRQNFMNKEIKAVIGIGGGSTLDTAKAIAVLVNNKDKAVAYRGFNKMSEPVLPIIAIPTTAGTGSEVTPNASFVDDEIKKKLGINGEAIRPKYAFLNPDMLVSCPKMPAISAGIDALVHAVEAFSSKNATYISKMFSKEAVGLMVNNLEKSVIHKDKDSLEKVFLGSLFAGIAMMNSGAGPAAALSYPLGVHKKVPHGIAGGVFLPRIMEWNFQNKYYGYCEFAEYIFGQRVNTTEKEITKKIINQFKNLWRSLKVPSELIEYGFGDDDVDLFVSDVLELMGALEQNPIKFGEKEIRYILKDCM